MINKLHSIRTRILLWFVSALFVVMLLFGLSFYFFMQDFLYTNAERLIRDKNFAVGGWIDYRLKDMNLQVNGYKQSQEANIFIQVTDLDRNILGKTDNLQSSLPIEKSLAKEVYQKDNVIITRYHSPQYGDLLIANGTGLTNGKILGFVQVAIQEKEITKTLDSVMNWILLSIPVLLLFSILIGYFLTKRLIKPFALISSSANEMSFNELNSSRLPVFNPQDELGKLTITINNLLDRLNDAVNLQQQFVADAAHELRTPLAIIRSEIEIALRNNSTEDYAQILNSNLEEVNRLTSITDNLISLTRFDANRDSIQFERVQLNPLIQSVIERFTSRLIDNKMQLSFESNANYAINANKPYLEQLFINLIDNAIKYSHSGASIVIRLSSVDRNVLIQIEDSGIGISKEDMPFIFNRFYRVDKSRSSAVPGSGLGLAIVKSIVEIHHGTIELKSELGKGTTFSIFIPQ